MLDLAKVAAAIAQSHEQLWADEQSVYTLVTDTWDQILKDPLFAYRVAAIPFSPWALPSWHESLCDATFIIPYVQPYTIISSDGSQIYPDRHEGISCGLINIGTVVIPYRNNGLGVELTSEPILVLPHTYPEGISPHDAISIQRQGYELKYAAAKASSHVDTQAVLFDGSLIFWHLQAIIGFEAIIQNYCGSLGILESQAIPYGFYISAPKSKDLLNLVRLQLCNFIPSNEAAYASVSACTDSTIMHHHLKVGERSIFFKSSAPVTLFYPVSQQPYFCYLRTSVEVGRLELPAWLVQDTTLCAQFIAQVADQLEKGNGYPIALAEAHEQAVVKGPDRELFYMLLAQSGMHMQRSWLPSAKQIHKNRPLV